MAYNSLKLNTESRAVDWSADTPSPAHGGIQWKGGSGKPSSGIPARSAIPAREAVRPAEMTAEEMRENALVKMGLAPAKPKEEPVKVAPRRVERVEKKETSVPEVIPRRVVRSTVEVDDGEEFGEVAVGVRATKAEEEAEKRKKEEEERERAAAAKAERERAAAAALSASQNTPTDNVWTRRLEASSKPSEKGGGKPKTSSEVVGARAQGRSRPASGGYLAEAGALRGEEVEVVQEKPRVVVDRKRARELRAKFSAEREPYGRGQLWERRSGGVFAIVGSPDEAPKERAPGSDRIALSEDAAPFTPGRDWTHEQQNSFLASHTDAAPFDPLSQVLADPTAAAAHWPASTVAGPGIDWGGTGILGWNDNK